MMFLVSRSSLGSVSRESPCKGAVRGVEASAWPGEYQWHLELNSLDELVSFLADNGGALGLFSPEEDEEHPMIEIFDDDQLEE